MHKCIKLLRVQVRLLITGTFMGLPVPIQLISSPQIRMGDQDAIPVENRAAAAEVDSNTNHHLQTPFIAEERSNTPTNFDLCGRYAACVSKKSPPSYLILAQQHRYMSDILFPFCRCACSCAIDNESEDGVAAVAHIAAT